MIDLHPEWGTEMSNHSGMDLREAEYWGEILRDKELQKDPSTSERFYVDLKRRLTRRFGTITQAFKEIDAAGDGTINFIEWNSMLLLMHLPLETRACRFIFGLAARGEKQICLEDLKVVLLQPMVRKMKAFVHSYKRFQDRVNRHVQSFLGELTESNHEIEVASVDRFQRRIKLPFCRGVYDKTTAIHSVAVQLQSKCIQDVAVDLATLGEMIVSSVGSFGDGGLLLECQVPYLMSIFSRVGIDKGVGVNRGSSISLVDLMAALTILSTDVDRCGKLRMMFEVFDTDEDTVLEDHQLKDLFCLLCKTSPLFQSTPALKPESGAAFQEELSEQEGLRNYECARWRLHRRGNNEDAVNWHELWAAIRDQPDVMASLLPAPPPIRWALDPLPVHMQDWMALLPRATTPLDGLHSRASSSHGKRHGMTCPVNHHSRSLEVTQCKRYGLTCPAHLPAGSRPGSNSAPSRPRSKDAKRKKGTPPQGNTWKPQLAKNLTAEFEKDLTDGFRRRLRRLGTQRVIELREGVSNPSGRASPRTSTMGDGDTRGSIVGLSSMSLQPRASQLCSRTCSLPHLSSRGNTLKGIASGGLKNHLSRVSTAPMGLGVSLVKNSVIPDSSNMSSSRLDKLPLVDSLSQMTPATWGMESAERHRLLVAASCEHSHGPDLRDVDAYRYNCHLCERIHALNPSSPKHEDLQEH